MGKRKGKDSDSEDENQKKERKSKKDRKDKRSDSEEDKKEKKSRKDRSEKKEKKKDKDKKHKSDRKEEKKRKKEEKRKKKEDKKLKKEKLLQDAAAFMEKVTEGKFEEISEDDYFVRNSEFRVWLKEVKNTFFDELSADDARGLFSTFVLQWNSKVLPYKFYSGIKETDLDASVRTRYKWNFANKVDQHELATVRDSVDTATFHRNYNTVDRPDGGRGADFAKPAPRGAHGAPGPPAGPTRSNPGTDPDFDAEEAARQARLRQRKESKDFQRRVQGDLDDLAPKPDPGSFQARMEKRAVKGAYARGGREGSPEFNDRDIMGGGDDFQSRVARERERREKREMMKAAQTDQKRSEYEAKEKERMDRFLKEMGLVGKLPSTLAPRPEHE